MATSLQKQPYDDELFDFDFTNRLRDGETISSITSIDDTDSALTYGVPVIDATGKIVQCTVGGGLDGTTYKITVRVVTTLSPQLEEESYLVVVET